MIEALVSTRPCDGDAILVEVRGALDDTAVLSQLRRTLVDVMLHRPAHHVVIDLVQVTDIDGVGIGTVVAGCDALDALGMSVLVRGRAVTLTRLRADGLPQECAPAV